MMQVYWFLIVKWLISFEEVLKSTKFAKKACNWIIGDVSAYLNKNNLSFAKVPCSSENLG